MTCTDEVASVESLLEIGVGFTESLLEGFTDNLLNRFTEDLLEGFTEDLLDVVI